MSDTIVLAWAHAHLVLLGAIAAACFIGAIVFDHPRPRR